MDTNHETLKNNDLPNIETDRLYLRERRQVGMVFQDDLAYGLLKSEWETRYGKL